MPRRFLLALTLSLALAGPARAAPVVAVMTGFFTSIGIGSAFAGALAGFLVNTVVSAALSRLSASLRKKKQQPQAGIKTEATQTGGTSPMRFPLGLTATGGQLIAPPNSFGQDGETPNVWLVYPIALSVIPGATLQRVIVNDTYVPLDANPQGSWGRFTGGDFPQLAQIDYHNGGQTSADSDMLAAFGSDPDRPWLGDMIGPGLCWLKARFKYSREHFNGLPSVRVEVLGIPLYDPRKDSTAGGSGPQRWGNRSTWTQSTNLIVMVWNIMRGIEIAPGLIWGGGYEAEDLPLAAWFAAMNACDLPIADGAGGTVPQYRGGIEVALDDEPLDVVEELLKACCGEMAEIGGYWDVRVGASRLPAFHITDEDILISQEQEYDPAPSLLDTFNGITASYPEPESLWEAKDAPPRYNPTWEAEDGGRRLVAELQLSACPFGEQVQRLMAAQIADHRRFRRHRFVLPPDAASLSPLDSISWTSERHGYTGKVFELRTLMDSLMTLRQGVALREVDGDDFSWAPGDLIPSVPVPTVTTPPAPRAVPGFAVAPAVVVDQQSRARRPAIDLHWTPAAAEDAWGIGWQLRLAGEAGEGVPGTHGQFADGMVRLVGGVLPMTDYEVRARLLLDRAVDWTAWLPVTTPDVRLSPDDMTAELAADLAELDDWIGAGIDLPDDLGGQAQTLRGYADQLRALTAEVVEGGARALLAEQEVRGYLASAELRLGTRIDVTDQQVTVIATAVLSLQATIPGLATADALSALVTRVTSAEGVVTSLADSLTALSASVGQVTASGLMRVTVEATPAGALSRIGLKAAATGPEGDTRQAALYLEAVSGNKSRVIVQADQFAISNGGATPAFPFLIEGDQVFLRASMRSADYQPGVSGWIIRANGDAEFGAGQIRRGSITNRFAASNGAEKGIGVDWADLLVLDIACDGNPVSVMSVLELDRILGCEFRLLVDWVERAWWRGSSGYYRDSDTLSVGGTASGMISASGYANGSSVSVNGFASLAVNGWLHRTVTEQFYAQTVTHGTVITPAAGNRNLRLQARRGGGYAPSGGIVRNIFVETTELKR